MISSVSDPIAGATGRGVRIAVIDSGVHPGHPHIDAARLVVGVHISREGRIENDTQAILDRLGHGTAVTAAIQERAPASDILTVRVFHDALRASAMALVTAIDWCVDAGADIINMSLGSTNATHRDAFSRAAEHAVDAGILLVAAQTTDGTPCLPGALPSVLGVELDWDCPRGSYRMAWNEGIPTFAAAGYPRPINGIPPRRNLYGVSFAVAQISGLAALACEQVRAAKGVSANFATDVPDFLADRQSATNAS